MERERAKNIIRRAHDPLSCLERCKSNSARLLGLEAISDKTPITKGGEEIREKPGSGPDVGTLCAGAAETAEPSLACDALTNFEERRRAFKVPPPIAPPVFIPVMEVVVSRWRNKWEAGGPTGIACRLQWQVKAQWQVNAGLVGAQDRRALFVGFDPGKISEFNRLIQDPGGLLRQRRGSTKPRKRRRNSHKQGLLHRCATLTICLCFGLMVSCNSESLGLISKKRLAFLDIAARQSSMDKNKSAVRFDVSDKEEDHRSVDDHRALVVHGSAIVGTLQKRGKPKQGTHNPNNVVLRETGEPMEGEEGSEATIKPADQHMLDMEKNAKKRLASPITTKNGSSRWRRTQRVEAALKNKINPTLTTQGCGLGALRDRPDIEDDDNLLQPLSKKILMQVPSLELCLGRESLTRLRQEEGNDAHNLGVYLGEGSGENKQNTVQQAQGDEEDGRRKNEVEATSPGAAGTLTGAKERACQEP